MIRWDAPVEASRTIARIADRAYEMSLRNKGGVWYQKSELMMDLTACHLNGCQLQLEELLVADDTDFAHDVFGIRHHIDRKTGKLMNSFLPRYAKPEAA